MKPKSMNTASEMVISAVHSLGEKNGTSPQDIVRFISGKYKIDSTELKSHVQAALKRCITFGLLSRESGLYRLKEINEIPAQIIPIVPVERTRRKRRQKKSKKRHSCKKRMKRRKAISKGKKNAKIAVRRIYNANLNRKKKCYKAGKSFVKINRSSKQKIIAKNLEGSKESNDGLINKHLENVSQEKEMDRDENNNNNAES